MAGLSDDQLFKNKVILTILQYKLSIKTLRTFLPDHDTKDVSQLDITALCKYLSEKPDFLPANFDGKWDKLPSEKDQSKCADVFRIRIRRNQTFHAPESGIEQALFKEIWDELEDVYLRALGREAKNIIKEIETLPAAQTKEYETIKAEWATEFRRLEERIEPLEQKASGRKIARIRGPNIKANDIYPADIEIEGGGPEDYKATLAAIQQKDGDVDINAEKDVILGDIAPLKIKLNCRK